MPFWTTSLAALTSWATLGLASKACGSVLGLLSMAEALAYLPPIWLITFAYSFSAPTATIFWPPGSVDAGPDEQAAASRPAVTLKTANAIPRRAGMVKLLLVRLPGLRGRDPRRR